jgi:alpha-galactosidase
MKSFWCSRVGAGIILLASSFFVTLALDNGLGRTPSMGYNSWYSVFEHPTEQICHETLNLLQSLGFRAAGYEYLYVSLSFD